MTQERIETPEEFLEHFGVKGMKWGHRKGQAAGGIVQRTKRRYKMSTTNVKTKTGQAKAAVTVGKNREAAKNSAAKKRVDYLNNPDRVTAQTLSRGEKVAMAILFTPVGAVAAIKGQNALANHLEYQQKSGAYDKRYAKKG